jgi:hypothetical protein
MDWVMEILQWVIPAGGIGSVLVWLTSRTLRQLRKSKEIHDTYKSMYQDISETLCHLSATTKDLRDENENLRRGFTRLERAVTRAINCRHYNDCPVRAELQKHPDGKTCEPDGIRFKDGQHKRRDRTSNPGGTHSGGAGGTDTGV